MKRRILKIFLSVAFAAMVSIGFVLTRPVNVVSSAEETEEPLMRIALFSDLHVEYGLQKKEKPIRFSTTKAARYARTLTGDQGVDLVLVGGDMTGGRGSWNEAEITKTKQSVYDTMSSMTKDGKVLFVTGNHDPEPSVKAGNGVPTTDYSGDYVKFMTDACGEFVSSLYADDIDPSLSPYNELLCYRYTINNMEFLGMNTPYVESQGDVCGLYLQQAQWLEEQLTAIGKDKTVFLLCHYPTGSLKTIVSPTEYAPSGSGSVQGTVTRLLASYPNVVYCYGHVHSGDTWWAKNATMDTVKLQGNLSLAGQNAYRSNGYVYAHMGSMGYYDNVYQPGGLSEDDPVIVQFVMVEVYANRIVFQTHNTGNKAHPDGVREVAPLTVVRDMSAQFGLDSSEGVYDPKAYASSGSSAESSDKTSDKTSAGTDSKTTDGTSSGTSSVPSQNGGNSSLLPIIILVVLLVIAAACVVVLILVSGKKKSAKPVEEEK